MKDPVRPQQCEDCGSYRLHFEESLLLDRWRCANCGHTMPILAREDRHG